MRDVGQDIPDPLSSYLRAFGTARLSFILSTAFQAVQKDVLFIGHINLLPVAILAKLMNPRLALVLFVHGDEVWNDPVYRRRRFYEPFLLKFVNRIASVSQYTAKTMAHAFRVPEAVFVIFPNAVDPLINNNIAVRKEQTLLTVSRLAVHDHGKHIDCVLRAFAMIAVRRSTARLDIIGDGILRMTLQSLAAELGIKDRVRFLGRVSDTELDCAYRRASGFVLPSSKEGFGIVFLEAWQRGLPVICGSEGASREIVSDCIDGFVVDPNDIAMLASRMNEFISDPVSAIEMGRRGKLKVDEHYLDINFKINLKALINTS
nr:glycosyltransferase family 4 protein [Rhodoblastus sphagnicola]